MLTHAPKGTKDVMPDQAYKWQYIEKKFAEICADTAFRKSEHPCFNYTELFRRV